MLDIRQKIRYLKHLSYFDLFEVFLNILRLDSFLVVLSTGGTPNQGNPLNKYLNNLLKSSHRFLAKLCTATVVIFASPP